MFELVEELFRSTKPGLSAFADEPQKVVRYCVRKFICRKFYCYVCMNIWFSLLSLSG